MSPFAVSLSINDGPQSAHQKNFAHGSSYAQVPVTYISRRRVSVSKRLNVGSRKQRYVIAQGL